jgi:hypothetical protein
MSRPPPFVAVMTAAITLLSQRVAGPLAAGPAIAISGTQLALDGQETFLPGVSLFDGLGATPPRDDDLNALRQWGVKVVRVWAHWSAPIYDGDGSLSAAGRTRLAALIGRLRSRGLVLELVLLRPGQLPGQKYAVFASPEARIRAVTSIAHAPVSYTHLRAHET